VAGGPTTYAREIELPHLVSDRGYEAIADVVRQRLGLPVAQVGRTLSAHSPTGTLDHFSLTSTDAGTTKIRIDGDWRGLGLGVVAIGSLTTLFGTAATFGILADLMTHGIDWYGSADAGIARAAVTVGTALALVGGSTFFARRSASRAARRNVATHEGTFEAVLALAEKHAVRAEVPKTRVAETENESGAVAEATTPEASEDDGAVRPRRSDSPRS
jgi:hypothetical protein